MDHPLVSVIIPTYNRREYVQEAIDSALGQTYKNVEIVVVDDGSTDQTQEALCNRYGKQIHYFFQDNQGESVARNVAIRRSTGEYIALLDSDDIWLPHKLEQQVAFMEQQPEVGLVAAHILRMNEQGQIQSSKVAYPDQLETRVPLEQILLDSPLHASTLLARRNCINKAGLFRPEIRYGEDWDFCLRLAACYPVGFINEPLAAARYNPESQSGYLVSLTEVQRRLKDRTNIVNTVFPLINLEEGQREELKKRTLAREYGRVAMHTYILGDKENGKQLLSQALAFDPNAWRDGRRVEKALFQFASELGRRRTEDAAIDFLKNTLANLPPELHRWQKQAGRKLLSRLHVEFAFLNKQRGRSVRVRHHALRGIRHDLSWLRNLGLLSILLRSLWRQAS